MCIKGPPKPYLLFRALATPAGRLLPPTSPSLPCSQHREPISPPAAIPVPSPRATQARASTSGSSLAAWGERRADSRQVAVAAKSQRCSASSASARIPYADTDDTDAAMNDTAVADPGSGAPLLHPLLTMFSASSLLPLIPFTFLLGFYSVRHRRGESEEG